jgi:hypothetical protein
MADNGTPNIPAPLVAAKLPDATAKSGKVCSLACNLPHGLIIIHEGKKLVMAGANHPRAIKTSLAFSGMWGITHNVDEDWFDHWVATHPHPAVTNGHIMKNTAAKIVAQAEATGDAVKTGTDQLDPEKPGQGVEQRTEED